MFFKHIFGQFRIPFKNYYRLLVSPQFRYAPKFLLVYCASHSLPDKLEISSPETLTHKFLLKQGSDVVVNAVSQLLHRTVLAYVDYASEYKKAIDKQISFIENFLQTIGDIGAEEEYSDSMIKCRAEMRLYKEEFILESLLLYVENMVNSTSQATFLAGAEFSSLTLSEQLVSAKREIEKAKREVEITEQSYLIVEREAIEMERKKKEKHK